jgi:hypothetical protein
MNADDEELAANSSDEVNGTEVLVTCDKLLARATLPIIRLSRDDYPQTSPPEAELEVTIPDDSDDTEQTATTTATATTSRTEGDSVFDDDQSTQEVSDITPAALSNDNDDNKQSSSKPIATTTTTTTTAAERSTSLGYLYGPGGKWSTGQATRNIDDILAQPVVLEADDQQATPLADDEFHLPKYAFQEV